MAKPGINTMCLMTVWTIDLVVSLLQSI